MHAAAALEFRRPAVGRAPAATSVVASDSPLLVLGRPLSRTAAETCAGKPSARAVARDHRGVRAGRDKHGQPQVVSRGQQRVVCRHQFLGDVAEVGTRDAGSISTIASEWNNRSMCCSEAKQPAAEGAQLFGHRRALDKSAVGDRQLGLATQGRSGR